MFYAYAAAYEPRLCCNLSLLPAGFARFSGALRVPSAAGVSTDASKGLTSKKTASARGWVAELDGARGAQDGLLFMHRDALYEAGPSPLQLAWSDAGCSARFYDYGSERMAQVVAAEPDKAGKWRTDEVDAAWTCADLLQRVEQPGMETELEGPSGAGDEATLACIELMGQHGKLSAPVSWLVHGVSLAPAGVDVCVADMLGVSTLTHAVNANKVTHYTTAGPLSTVSIAVLLVVCSLSSLVCYTRPYLRNT